VSVGTALVAGAAAGPALTKAQYLAKLRAANARSAGVDDAAGAAIGSKTTTPAQVKARFLAMARTHIAIGKSFAAITPPRTATKANADFAHAQTVLGQQDKAVARKLPATKAAIVKYIQSLKPPSGGELLDRAINELHAAGFKV
jgi:hypothetical protein